MKLASFDIFDTTLIRKCGKPDNIFYLLAHRLYPCDEAKREEFIAWRKSAERVAAATLNGRQITIGDIYWYGGGKKFKEYTLPQLIDAEEAVESENLTANPAIKAVIERHKNQGDTICFISDMYLDSRFLATVLKREGCLQEEEFVYVSCEMGARKSSGTLYNKVRDLLRPTAWEHYGDHPISDIRRARERGIKAHLVESGYTETEKMLTLTDSYALRCLAGLQRAARIEAGCSAHATLAADFVAPAYIPYVHFVMQKAAERGIKKLYFLSRDSYILQKIAEQAQHPTIELKYLFVSRKALVLPYLKEPSAEKFLAVQDKQTIVGQNTEKLLRALGTSSEEIKKKFSIEFSFNKISNKKEEQEFLCKIFGDRSAFRPHLQQMATEKRTLLNEYFAQEGLLDGTKSAMVDVGWLGTTRLMINSILREEGHSDTLFFYYGVRGDVYGAEHGAYESYYKKGELTTTLTTLIENYFSASPYPSTSGYERVDGAIKPTFAAAASYKENNITTANTAAAVFLAKEIMHTAQYTASTLRAWCEEAAKAAESLKAKDIDITPLCEAEDFDGQKFVKRLSLRELLNIMLLGGRCTAFDKASVRLTVGAKAFSFVWPLCYISGQTRRFLFLTFKGKRLK